MPLTMQQKERILRDVSLGVAPPDDEPEEARHWRERMETQVDEMREQGMKNMIPFDPVDEDSPALEATVTENHPADTPESPPA
jgi:hypothetical protein